MSTESLSGSLAALAAAASDEFPLDALAEAVDNDDELCFLLHGRCHLMAVALHEATGLPIGAWIDGDGEGASVLLHAFVLDGDHGIDVRGRRPLEDIASGFEAIDPDAVSYGPSVLSVREVLEMGEGPGRLSAETEARLDGARAVAAAVLAATPPAGPSPSP